MTTPSKNYQLGLLLISVTLLMLMAVTILKHTRANENVREPLELRYTGNIDEDKAIDIVRSLPEVISWAATVETPTKIASRPVISTDRQGNGMIQVHVYELVRDDFVDKSSGTRIDSHTATFNWYTVEAKTLKIISRFYEH